jgi:hypothetical protein
VEQEQIQRRIDEAVAKALRQAAEKQAAEKQAAEKQPAPWTRKEKENIAHLLRSLRRSNDVISHYAELLRRNKKFEGVTRADVEPIRAAADEASDEAQLLRMDVLAKAHPDLPRMVRQTYLKEVNVAYFAFEGAWTKEDKEGHQMLSKEYSRLRAEREEWWDANRFELDIPEDVPYWDAERKNVIYK